MKIPWRGSLAAVLGFYLVSAAPRAQSTNVVNLRVAETSGIRRNTYPATARVHLQSGVLSDPAHARLLADGREVPAQFGVESSYPDGSVQWLTADFNVSIGPRETLPFTLEYGDSIKSAVVPRGLTVSQDSSGIQVGNVRFSISGAPLVLSVKYRQEDIGQGMNGFAMVDTAGVSHDATSSPQTKAEIVKRGPLLVVIRYSGQIPLASNYAAGYLTTVEMPNSKSWMKVTTTIADPEKRLRELSFHTPLSLGAQPWTWDFGTGSWSYGLLRAPSESVTLSQVVGTQQSTKWQIKSGPKGQEQIYEMTGGHRPNLAEGWGHIQDQKEAIAFAVPDFGAEAGTYTATLDGNGQMSFRWDPARPLPHLQLTVYEHFVATPVQVGAVTSPVSMLNPLVVSASIPK
ncbi:MAG TPA: hypothetical protein VGZ27_16005 [Vicinamibacterales bacterium]|jgi:hypothetical protein|nr:hypothetical protein [Vicinamibacterales bacterium]